MTDHLNQSMFSTFSLPQIQSITDSSRGSIRRKNQSALRPQQSAEEGLSQPEIPEDEVRLQQTSLGAKPTLNSCYFLPVFSLSYPLNQTQSVSLNMLKEKKMKCFTMSNPSLPLFTGCSVIPHWSLASCSPILTGVSSLSFTLSRCHVTVSVS